MNRVATLGRCIFCYPAPPASDGEDNEEDAFERNVRRLNEVFSWIDLINLFLDFIFSVRLISDGWRNEGLTLLGGTALAYISAHLGKRLVNKNGLEWAPFCQSSQTYYPATGRRESKLRILFALAFSELAIFMFEDVTTILVFFQMGPEEVDFLDQANLFATLVSAVIALSLLLCTLVYSIHCSCPTTSLAALTMAFLCRGVLALLFLLLFLTVLVIVLIAVLLTVLFVFKRSVFPDGDMEDTPFGLSVTVMWLIGFYFLHKIIRGRIQRIEDDDEEPDTSDEAIKEDAVEEV
mmetsp:Transcript_31262/g.51608  ORF Transcript_31262/g.51608 Transcript_31262/m.51608 type:complete len:293 (-) Transcript_31262:354-1232(-)|eukprot:CAMPEP_0119009574 /NCGR_PEP_ID=MMETSP1176-20130426/4457_1 /TAXON_ID=265551 /ORGANISM="Synedropsis recta cf, Strain CCMP1620" /LENGTH=292 /DNA_ID=CAMNT_0006962117 /DNA_START=88 /DNA_END=966 /DNA_ORIENTATION=-